MRVPSAEINATTRDFIDRDSRDKKMNRVSVQKFGFGSESRIRGEAVFLDVYQIIWQ
jgi:hypothetical protein